MAIKKRRKAVAYCRVSTLEQKKKGNGIDIQIRDATLCAERHGFLVERFYRDEGESGVKEERMALKQLMRDCRSGEIAVIILPSLDRLSREVRIAENLFHEFEKFKIKILIADMPQYNGGRKDVLIRQIMEAIAEDNRKEIIERLLKGRQERVRKGMFPGGNLPYGYVRKNGTVVVDPHEAGIVKEIYQASFRGCSGNQIASALNGRGHKQRNGKPWLQRQICRILQRKCLYGGGIVHYGGVIGKLSPAIFTFNIVP